MADVQLLTIPGRITLAAGENTLRIGVGPKFERGLKTLHIKVITATTNVKFNNSGDAADSLALYVAADELWVTVEDNFPLRILGTAGDTLDVSVI
jgi:hypothetical protein